MPPLYRIVEIVIYSLLNFLPFIILALYPFRHKLRFSKPVTFLLIGIVTLLQIGLGVWAGLLANGNAGLISAVSTLVYLGFYFTAVRANFGKTLFTLLMLSNIANLVVVASKCIEGMLFPAYAMQSYRWTFSAVMFCVELVTLIPLFLYMRRTFSDLFNIETAKPTWRYIWLIPATFYLVWFYHLYSSEMSSLEIALDPANAIFMLVINLGALLIYHMVVQHIQIIDRNLELTHENLQYRNLQDRITEARQAKHDIRHHISIMRSYLQQGEYSKLEAYLNTYSKTLPDDTTFVFCENRAVNVLLLYFAQQAKNGDIDFAVHTVLSENLPVSEADLSVLLGNLLENALDACSAQTDARKHIAVSATTNDTTLFLTVDNTFSGDLKLNRQGQYLSTKRKGSGLGLTSVSSIISRYGGTLDIRHDNGVFRVSIMLPLLDE